MRRTTFSLAALLLFAFCFGVARGQDNFVGFRGGVSLPRLSGGGDNEVSRDYKSRAAFNGGGFFEWAIRKRTSVQFEADFAGQGGKRKGVQPVTSAIPGLPPLPAGVYYFGDFETDAVLNYLEIPVLLKHRFGKNEKRRLFVTGGMFYGHLLNAHTKTSGSSTIYLDKNKTPLLIPPANQPLSPISFAATTNIKNDIHHENFGVTGGGGIEFPRGENYFFAEARFAYGLRQIQVDPIKNGSSHAGSLVLSFGYALKLR